MKKIFALLLSFTLLFSFCAAAFADETEGKCGENLAWTLSLQGVLTVSGEGVTAYRWKK